MRLRNFTISLLLCALAIVIAAPPITAAQFTADVVVERGQRTLTGRLYVRENIYRLDFTGVSGSFFLTINTITDTATVLDPTTKQYFYLPASSPPVIAMDPFQAARSAADLHLRQYLGSDSLDGWACDRYRIRKKNKKIFTEWRARELDFPILIVDHQDADTAIAALRNIELTRVMPELLEIPEGYTERQPEPEQPEDDGILKAGEEIRLPIDSTQYAEVTLINATDSPAQAVVILLKDGDELPEKVVGSIESRTFTLETKGEQIRRIWDTQADEVMIHVIQGEIGVDILQP